MRHLPIILIFIASTHLLFAQHSTGEWIAPVEFATLKIPIQSSNEAIAKGRLVYKKPCTAWHGTKGKGDGLGSISLNPKPADFSIPTIQEQTDGALYWKILKGRPPMESFENLLTEEEIWEVVIYIRTFDKINVK